MAAVARVVAGYESALAGVPNDELRGLVAEQYIQELADLDHQSVRMVGVALLGSADEDARELGRRALEWENTESKTGATDPAEMALDLLIVTVKSEELRACLAALKLPAEPDREFPDDVRLWTFESEGRQVGLTVVGSDGNVESAIEVLGVDAQCRFRAAVLIGMAAGLAGEVAKGDLVVSSWVIAHEFVRVTGRKYLPRYKAYPADPRSWQSVAREAVSTAAWQASVSQELCSLRRLYSMEKAETERLTKNWRPTVKVGVILAGSRIVEDGSLKTLKAEVHDRTLAAEMEGAGFAAACSYLRIPWLVVRGIADYGNEDLFSTGEGHRGKAWQFPSTYAAAAYVRDLVLRNRVPLIPG